MDFLQYNMDFLQYIFELFDKFKLLKKIWL